MKKRLADALLENEVIREVLRAMVVRGPLLAPIVALEWCRTGAAEEWCRRHGGRAAQQPEVVHACTMVPYELLRSLRRPTLR